jgi:hypothetical protein
LGKTTISRFVLALITLERGVRLTSNLSGPRRAVIGFGENYSETNTSLLTMGKLLMIRRRVTGTDSRSGVWARDGQSRKELSGTRCPDLIRPTNEILSDPSNNQHIAASKYTI